MGRKMTVCGEIGGYNMGGGRGREDEGANEIEDTVAVDERREEMKGSILEIEHYQ